MLRGWTIRLIVGADDGDAHALRSQSRVGWRRGRRDDTPRFGTGPPRSAARLTRHLRPAFVRGRHRGRHRTSISGLAGTADSRNMRLPLGSAGANGPAWTRTRDQ